MYEENSVNQVYENSLDSLLKDHHYLQFLNIIFKISQVAALEFFFFLPQKKKKEMLPYSRVGLMFLFYFTLYQVENKSLNILLLINMLYLN